MTIAELIERVRRYEPSADPEWLMRVYELAAAAHEGQRRASGESYVEHPLAVAGDPRRARDRSSDDRRRAAPRRGRRHVGHQRASGGAVRRRDRAAGRRRHQADPHPVSVEGRRAGREPAQDVPGDGQGHPRHHHQARRPPAQHADAREPPAREAAGDRARDARHLRADRAPPRHLEDQVGARGRVPALPRPAVVSARSSSASQRRGASARPTWRRRSRDCATSSRN